MRAGDADVKGAEHDRQVDEEESVTAVFEIARRGRTDLRGTDHAGQQERRQQPGEREHDAGQQELERDSGIENPADFAVVSFAVAARDQDLHADAEAEAEHVDGEKPDAAERGGSELDFSDPSEKGGVGEADHLLKQETEENRAGDPEDFAVAEPVHRLFSCGGVRHPV